MTCYTSGRPQSVREKSTLQNKRRLCPSHVLGSSGHVSGTSQIFSDVSTVRHMARLVLVTGNQPLTLVHSQKVVLLLREPCAFLGEKRCKCIVILQVSSTSSFSRSAFLVSITPPLGAHGLCAPGTARSAPHWRFTHCGKHGSVLAGTEERRRLRRRRSRIELGARSKSVCSYERMRLGITSLQMY